MNSIRIALIPGYGRNLDGEHVHLSVLQMADDYIKVSKRIDCFVLIVYHFCRNVHKRSMAVPVLHSLHSHVCTNSMGKAEASLELIYSASQNQHFLNRAKKPGKAVTKGSGHVSKKQFTTPPFLQPTSFSNQIQDDTDLTTFWATSATERNRPFTLTRLKVVQDSRMPQIVCWGLKMYGA